MPERERDVIEIPKGAAEVLAAVYDACYSVESALTRAHAYKNSTELWVAARRLGEDVFQLLDTLCLLDRGPVIRKTP